LTRIVTSIFERLPEDADALAVIVSLNVKRRNLTASQKAIAAASAWKQAEAEGRVQTHGGDRKSNALRGRLISSPRDYFAAQFAVGKNYVEMAREVLARSAAPAHPRRQAASGFAGGFQREHAAVWL
jgi:hypothetical protein